MRLLRNMLGAAIIAVTLVGAPPARAAAITPLATISLAPVADSLSWSSFWKFWKRQLDRTAGVVGVVMLVAAGATLIIISKTRR